jgi:stage V sporulation protein K
MYTYIHTYIHTQALETIMKSMEDMRDELIVILAGYTGQMEELLTRNPVSIKPCLCTHVYIYIYTYARAHIHTYTHTYIHLRAIYQQGLKSRFPIAVPFPDYTTDELVEIAMGMLKEKHFVLSEEAKNVMYKLCEGYVFMFVGLRLHIYIYIYIIWMYICALQKWSYVCNRMHVC